MKLVKQTHNSKPVMAKVNMQHLLFEAAAQNTTSNTLFFADENCQPEILPDWFKHKNNHIISNRFDVHQCLENLGYASTFSDFDLNIQQHAGFEQALLRISKEKLVNHYIIEQAYQALKPNGKLLLIGAKNEGIQSIQKQAATIFEPSKKLKFKPQIELYSFVKSSERAFTDIDLPALQAYPQLHTIAELNQVLPELELPSGLKLSSKAGVFGWKKLDQASLFLIHTGLDYLQNKAPNFLNDEFTLLDIGAGSGLLALAFSAKLMSETHATMRLQVCDNNAAAIKCCEQNLAVLKPLWPNTCIEVLASDCAQAATNKAELIVCNPPFHQGFETNSELPQRFIQSIAQHMHQHSLCLLVANQFVAYEKLAQKSRLNCHELARESGFKVLALTRQ